MKTAVLFAQSNYTLLRCHQLSWAVDIIYFSGCSTVRPLQNACIAKNPILILSPQSSCVVVVVRLHYAVVLRCCT